MALNVVLRTGLETIHWECQCPLTTGTVTGLLGVFAPSFERQHAYACIDESERCLMKENKIVYFPHFLAKN